MIVFDNVTKYYKSNVGLEKVSVRINKGDFVFLVGPSGAGKSTFIKLILKEIDATSGSIKVRGREVTTMSNRQVPILRRNIGIVFQDFRLLPKKTVYENVAFAMEIIHQPKKLIKKYVPQVLSMVGIASKANKYPDELSAGEQQRVAIARAIVNRPRILIADEPTGNLDPDTAWEIMQLLDQINKRGTTILMVTHAKDIVDKMGKRVIAIEKGRIVRDEFGLYGYAEALEGVESTFDTIQSARTFRSKSRFRRGGKRRVRRFFYTLKQAFLQVLRNRAMSVASIFAITAMLLILSIFFILVLNVNTAAQTIQQDYDSIEIYLKDDVTKEQANDIIMQVKEEKGVEDAYYKSKEAAMENFRNRWGDKNAYLLDSLNENPLPNSVVVMIGDLNYGDQIAKACSQYDGVEDVKYYKDTVDKLLKMTHFAQLAAIIVMIFLIIVSIVVVSNTIEARRCSTEQAKSAS